MLVRASWVGTGVFLISASLAVASESFRAVGVVTAVVLFAMGCLAFLSAFATGIERSRREHVTVPGLFFLSGSVPARTRWLLLGSALAQTTIAFTTASLRPFTSVAFGILVPMYGLGVAGLWAARHGTFPPRATGQST